MEPHWMKSHEVTLETILGLLLVMTYINNLAGVPEWEKIITCAYDTNMFFL